MFTAQLKLDLVSKTRICIYACSFLSRILQVFNTFVLGYLHLQDLAMQEVARKNSGMDLERGLTSRKTEGWFLG